MSDALTDIYRDERRGEVEGKLVPLEMKVLAGEATRKDVEEILRLWEEWVSIPRGYWTASNPQRYKQRKALYEELLNSGKITIQLKQEA